MGVSDLLLQCFSSVSLLGALVVLLLIYLSSSSSFSSREAVKGPPGPKPVPLFGNLLQIDLKKPYTTLLELSKKYGSVFTFYFGPKKVVFLTRYKTVKEALVNYADEFGDRDPFLIMDEYHQGHGITWANGESWREIRRFSLANLKDFGMGKKASEDKIKEECQHLIRVLKEFKGQPFDMTKLIYYSVSNVICSMVYGSRFECDDPVFKLLVDQTRQRLQFLSSPSILVYNFFPWYFKWIANKKEMQRLGDVNKRLNVELCHHLKETLNPHMCRGFVDAFLVRKQTLEESGITNSYFHHENLLNTVMNLFAAGTDTTGLTLRWGFLFMAKYPKIQNQVQDELGRIVGSREVHFQDRKNLHFTNAVIHETQRLANIVPMGLPHKTSRDVTFQGHFLKKGTTVCPFLTSVLYDESEWERPNSFYPAHFLDEGGKFIKRDAFMPFSAGRRACPGESLARMELFIFFTTLLQLFSFTPPPGVSEEELDLTPNIGLTLDPLPHKLCAVPRV